MIDGGFSVNQVVLDKETTLTVSPLSGDAHICPLDHSPGDAAEMMRVIRYVYMTTAVDSKILGSIILTMDLLPYIFLYFYLFFSYM